MELLSFIYYFSFIVTPLNLAIPFSQKSNIEKKKKSDVYANKKGESIPYGYAGGYLLCAFVCLFVCLFD